MHNDRLLKSTPQLSFDKYYDRWVLWLRAEDVPHSDRWPDNSYCCFIQVAWKGESWYDYKFCRFDAGEMFELVTLKEFEGWLETVEEHEGTEVKSILAEEQDRYDIVKDDHPVFRLRQYWEAIMALGLFDPHVTLKSWEVKPWDQELKAKLLAARERYQRDEMKAMDEAMEQ